MNMPYRNDVIVLVCLAVLSFTPDVDAEKNETQGQQEQTKESLVKDERSSEEVLRHIDSLMQSESWAELEDTLNGWMSGRPEDISTEIKVAVRLLEERKTIASRIAERILQAAMARNAQAVRAVRQVAQTLQAQGSKAASEKLYRMLLRNHPNDIIIMNNLAWMLSEDNGEHQEALAMAERALKLRPDYANLLDTHGVICLRLKRYDDAARSFARAISLLAPRAPYYALMHYHLAEAYEGMGQQGEARQFYQESLELNTRFRGLTPQQTSLAQSRIGGTGESATLESSTIEMPKEKLAIPSDMRACGKNLKKIYSAVKKYEKDKGRLPDWLSDLVPDYLNAETLFCPEDAEHTSRFSSDPKLSCSYGWHFSTKPIQLGWDATGRTRYREFKKEQIKVFGDIVPIVRCYHHGANRILNLSAGGDLWWGALTWEYNFIPDYASIHPQVLAKAAAARSEVDLRGGRAAPPSASPRLNSDGPGVVFYADFERNEVGRFPDSPISGAGKWESKGTERAVVEPSLGSNHTNSLVLRDRSTGEKRDVEVHCQLDPPLTGTIAIEWDAVVEQAAGDDHGFVYNVWAIGGRGSRGGSPVAWDLALKDNGFYEDGKHIPFEKGRVYHCRIDMDTELQRYSASIDGRTISANVPFNNDESNQLDAVLFSTFWDATCVVGIDNVVVRSLESMSSAATRTTPIPPEKLAIPEDMRACAKNLGIIKKAVKQYRKDKGKLPDWLSDLVPGYLSAETLHCPEDTEHTSRYAPDPKLPCSYSWQFSAKPIPPGHDPTGRTLYRDWKVEQVKIFGDVVPMVRCTHHGDNRVLNLSAGGDTWWGELTWEPNFRSDYASIHRQTLSKAIASRSPRPVPPRAPTARGARSYMKEVVSIPENKRAEVWAAYSSIDHKAIAKAVFTTHKIDGSNNDNNQLTPGSIFLCKTNEERLCKFLVEQYGYNLMLSWTTYERDGEVYSHGKQLTVSGTACCDLDQGEVGGRSPDKDFFWNQATKVERYLVPENGAAFVKLASNEASSLPPRRTDNQPGLKVMLDHTTDLSRWGVSYHRPESIRLAPSVPPQDWVVPPMSDSSLKCYWGTKLFGHKTQMNMIVHIPDDSKVDPWHVFVSFNEDKDFTTVTPFSVGYRKNTERIEFKVEYSDGTVNPYVIDVRPNPLNPGRFSLTYARKCIRTGIFALPEGRCKIAVVDDDSDGLYSDLQDTTIEIDRNERVSLASSVKVGDSQFFSVECSDDGSWISFQPADYGVIEGNVNNSKTRAPIPGATVKVMPHDFTATTDERGQYLLRLPVGRYYAAQVTASGHIPAHVRRFRIPVVSSDNASRLDVTLDPATIPEPGELTLSSSESYHFLTGQRHSIPVGGDFSFGASDDRAVFAANNRYQGGLVDLGSKDVPLKTVAPPASGYSRYGVDAKVGHVYVSRAKEGETGCHIIFRVKEITREGQCKLEYYYRSGDDRKP